MDDHAPSSKRLGPLPALPTLETAQARLAAGLPPNFAAFAADLLAYPDPDEPSHHGHDVLQPNTAVATREWGAHASSSVGMPGPDTQSEATPAPQPGKGMG